MRLVKSHGIGNDYLVLASNHIIDGDVVRALCHRNTGIGGDGVLEAIPSDVADFGLRIWNPDGSVAEKSGNGLRIFARYLVDHCLAPLVFTIEVGGSIVGCEVHASGQEVTVAMGQATLSAPAIPATRALVQGTIEVCGQALTATAVGIGNPHCVVFVDALLGPNSDLDALPWRAWGAALEVHPWFPNRTNVQFVRVVDASTLELRVWERGAGETLASGSSACAATVAAFVAGYVAGSVQVCMPGGTLAVTVNDTLDVVLRGPVEEVAVIATSRTFGEKAG